MARLRTLIFHPALATYRIDLFNALNRELDLKVWFLNRHVHYHKDLNQDRLRAALECDHDFISTGFSLMQRDFRTGMGRIIREHRPDVVVTHEFSYLTLYILACKKLFSRGDCGLTLWTAENPKLLRDRGGIRRRLRLFCGGAADSMIVY
ncbi:hypothetical protein HQ520_17750, partial [bacterium]|nr:hypothetical protein [bacterium]